MGVIEGLQIGGILGRGGFGAVYTGGVWAGGNPAAMSSTPRLGACLHFALSVGCFTISCVRSWLDATTLHAASASASTPSCTPS